MQSMTKRTKTPRGAATSRVVRALRRLEQTPTRVVDLAEHLSCSLATAKRVVAGLREAGEPVEAKPDGREVRYFIRRG